MPNLRPGLTGASRGAAPYGVKSAAATPMRPAIPGEEMLYAYLQQVAELRSGQRALIFRLSRLQRSHRRDKHLQIVANMLQEVLDQYPGRLFQLRNGDVVMVCKGITRKAIDETTELLRYLFNDDPLAREGAEQADFCVAYDLEVNHPDFLAALEEIRESEAKLRNTRPPPVNLAASGETGPLDSARASDLIAAMNRIDLSTMGRRQTVWEMVPGKPAQPRFDEFFFSIDKLRSAIGDNFDLAKDRQLFFYLMRWLDRYMLTTLLRDHLHFHRPLSVNVNLSTLLSPEFATFDGQRPTDWRDRLILEIQLADLWSDLPAFLTLSEGLKRRGYQRCLDGVLYKALPFINFRRFDVDYVKVVWDDALLQLDDKTLRELCAAIADCGKGRIVLTRCGRREAIRVGQAMGIQLFQGWQVDHANQAP
ncbi:MAG TPA: EAL domain-containing protein [Stellaceae bacterium]|nr:EAL domain-containing protein [Stellaceae bacterium]